MTAETLNWEDVSRTHPWYTYLEACVAKGEIFGIGYSRDGKSVGVFYDERTEQSKFTEYITISNGAIVDFGRYAEDATKDQGSPVVLWRNFGRIKDSIPDETAKQLLKKITDADLRKIKPSDFEEEIWQVPKPF